MCKAQCVGSRGTCSGMQPCRWEGCCGLNAATLPMAARKDIGWEKHVAVRAFLSGSQQCALANSPNPRGCGGTQEANLYALQDVLAGEVLACCGSSVLGPGAEVLWSSCCACPPQAADASRTKGLTPNAPPLLTQHLVPLPHSRGTRSSCYALPCLPPRGLPSQTCDTLVEICVVESVCAASLTHSCCPFCGRNWMRACY